MKIQVVGILAVFAAVAVFTIRATAEEKTPLAAAAAAPASAPTLAGAARVVGLVVAQKDLTSGVMPGTQLHVRIARPGASILGVDNDASKLLAFTDEKGTDLRQKDQWIWPFLHESDDKQACTVTFKSEKLPAAGARELSLRAVVAFRTGADPKVAETKELALTEGTTVAAGVGTWNVKSVKAENGGVTVVFESETSFDAVSKYEFVGPNGPIAHDERGGGGWSINGKGSWSRHFFLPGAPKTVTLRVSYWARMESVKVPVDVKAGVGF